jgi:hexosaminidase
VIIEKIAWMRHLPARKRLLGAGLLAVLGTLLVIARLAIALVALSGAPNLAPLVIPTLREWHGGQGTFTLNSGSRILVDPVSASALMETAQLFRQDLLAISGYRLPVLIASRAQPGDFLLTLQNNDRVIGDEGYILSISDVVSIGAHTAQGVFYGTRSVLQILMQDPLHTHIARGTARDYPAYRVRGFMLDVGRRFFSIGLLEDYVRLLSWFKMNDFQLHLNDNAPGAGRQQDWRHQYAAFRLQSARFPGLAARDGAYSYGDIAALEAVARSHAVTITPEIDAPAHDLAFTQYRPDLASPRYSKEFLDLSNPASYSFLEALWSEFLPWFATDQVHIGADEYTPTDADRYITFINRLDDYLTGKGKTVRVWGSLSVMKSRILVHKNIVIDVWNNRWANPVAMARAGFQIINMNDRLLYIVPRAGYYQDYLDTRTLYQKWEPYIFDLSDSRLNLQPDDPHLLGGMFALWNDKLNVVSDAQIDDRLEPAIRVLAQKLWSAATSLSYEQFEQLALQISEAPGTHLPQLPLPLEVSPHSQGQLTAGIPLVANDLWWQRRSPA